MKEQLVMFAEPGRFANIQEYSVVMLYHSLSTGQFVVSAAYN